MNHRFLPRNRVWGTLALSVAAGLGRMVQPMFNALYPRFSRLVAQHDGAGLLELYHLSSQYLAVVIAAVAAVLVVFAHEVLFSCRRFKQTGPRRFRALPETTMPEELSPLQQILKSVKLLLMELLIIVNFYHSVILTKEC